MSPRFAAAAATVILISVAAVPRARAADPAPAAPAPGPAGKAEARERFDRGLGLFEKGDNAAALAEFKRAFELMPNPVVLYNIGLVYAAMNRPVEATDTLDRFLAEASPKSAAEQLRQARKVRDEQAARVAHLMVLTDQPSTIEIDGVEAGQTPMSQALRLASGAHTIAAVAAGYQPSRREVTLAGATTETVSLTLLPTEASVAHLTLSVAVPGAEVWINDKRVGTTPLPADVAVAPGPIRVELRRPGYFTTARTLRLDAGATATLELPLGEDPAAAGQRGRLRLAVAATGPVELSVDGASRALSDDGIRLPGGPHRLRIQRVGYEPYDSTIVIAPARDLSLAVDLRPTLETRSHAEESARARGVLGWSLAGGGVLIVGAAAVYAIVSRHDVAHAQAALDKQLSIEQMNTADNDCYLGPNPMNPGYYDRFGCAATKSNLQSQVDTAKWKRIAAYSGIGVGAIATGIGAYLLATSGGARDSGAPEKRLGLWTSERGGGLALFSTF